MEDSSSRTDEGFLTAYQALGAHDRTDRRRCCLGMSLIGAIMACLCLSIPLGMIRISDDHAIGGAHSNSYYEPPTPNPRLGSSFPIVQEEKNRIDSFCLKHPNREECSETWTLCHKALPADNDSESDGSEIQCGSDSEGARLVRFGAWSPSSTFAESDANQQAEEYKRGEYVYTLAMDGKVDAKRIASIYDWHSPRYNMRRCYAIGEDASWTLCAKDGETCALRREGQDGTPQLVKFASTYDDPTPLFQTFQKSFKCGAEAFKPQNVERGTTLTFAYMNMEILSPAWVFPMHLSPNPFRWVQCSTSDGDEGRNCALENGGSKIVRMRHRQGRSSSTLYRMATGAIKCDLSMEGFGLSEGNGDGEGFKCSWWRGGRWHTCAQREHDACLIGEVDKQRKNGTLVRLSTSHGSVAKVLYGLDGFDCNFESFISIPDTPEQQHQYNQRYTHKSRKFQCDVLQLNVTETIAQWVAEDPIQRQISRAAYLFSSALANITMQTPMFTRPTPYIFRLEQDAPEDVFARKLIQDSKQCPLKSQAIVNVKDGFFHNTDDRNMTCGKYARGSACCVVDLDEMESIGNETLTHGRKLLSIDADLDDYGERKKKRIGWVCGLSGVCGGLHLSDIKDLLNRLFRLFKGLPRSRLVRVPLKLLTNLLTKLGSALFQYIPTMVQLSIYYSISAYLTNKFQAQGFKQILMDVIGASISVVPYALLHCPIQAMNRRVQADGDTMKGAAEFIWRKHKLPGFVVGLGPEIVRQMAFMPIWSLIQGSIELLLMQQGQGHIYQTMVQATAGAISGGVAAFIAHPADIIYERVLKAEPGTTNMFKEGKAIIQEDGFRSLYRGGFQAAQQQSLQTAVFMSIMAQLQYFLNPKDQDGPVEADTDEPLDMEEMGTAELPFTWEFDEWDAVNRSLAVKPNPHAEDDESWKYGNEEKDKEFKEMMEKWADLDDEQRAELMKKYSESQYSDAAVQGTH